MSCIFKLFQGKQKVPERTNSFSYKFSDPLPATLDELHPIELLLRKRLDRLNRRFETASKDLAYAREKQDMKGILVAMKLRRDSEDEFKAIKNKLNEIVDQRTKLERIKVVANPSHRPILTIQVPKT